VDLLRAYGAEVRMVNDIYHTQKERPTAPVNSAPRSGAVNWVRGLKQRVDEPMARMQTLSNLIMVRLPKSQSFPVL
jgi:dynein heavy chain